MLVRYIGRQPFFKGKPLYEICRQLRDLGVGRVVYRTSTQSRYPLSQKTYVKLSKVIPDMTCPDPREPSISEAWGFLVFRGKVCGDVKLTAGHKPDWVLVPKEEEAKFCQITDVAPVEVMPKEIDCPPLLNMVLKQELAVSKMTVSDKIKIPYIGTPNDKEIRRLLL